MLWWRCGVFATRRLSACLIFWRLNLRGPVRKRKKKRIPPKKKRKKKKPLWQPIYFFVFQDSVETDLFKSLLRRPSSSLRHPPLFRTGEEEEDCFLKPHYIILFKSFFFFFFFLLSFTYTLPTHWGTNGHSTCPASHLQRVNRSVIFSEPRIHVSI